MTFPLLDRPFAPLPLQIPRSQCDDYARLAQMLLHSTLREYEHYASLPVASNGQRLTKKHWKLIKRREALTVFRRRTDKISLLDDVSPMASSFDWSLPKLVLTGSIVGTLDDVLYGSLATTGEAMRVRSVYVEDELLDADVLHAIQLPTPDAPFQFLGLKWAVRSFSSNPMVWPRDTVVLEATGVHTCADGTRLGYRIVHSVQLPQCPELPDQGIVRTRMSSTALYRQMDNGTVDVYATRFVESSGNLSNSIALAAAANAMIGSWKAVWCAQNRKLAVAALDGALRWEVEGTGKIERLVVTTDDQGHYCCGLCLKGYKLYSSVTTCQACNLMVCSRCRVGRRLARVGYQSQVIQLPVLFCKSCMAEAIKANAWEVASGECVTHMLAKQLETAPRKRGETATQGLQRSKSEAPTVSITKKQRRAAQSYRGESMASDSTFSGSLDGLEPLSLRDAGEIEEGDEFSDELETLDDWDREHVQSFYAGRRPPLSKLSISDSEEEPSPTGEVQIAVSTDYQKQQLWAQMSRLCVAAEETYRLAKRNADAMGPKHRRMPTC